MAKGRIFLLLVGMLTVLPWTSALKDLKCGEQCHCYMEEKGIVKERRIICNETGAEPVQLVDEILPSLQSDISKIYVRVENSSQLMVTEGFLRAWKGFNSCALDIWNVDFIGLPKTLPEEKLLDPLKHVFAGIGIRDCTVDELPRHLFGGKRRAGLRIINSTVGIIQAEVFSNVGTLSYLEVSESDIGIFKGPANTTDKLSIWNPTSKAVHNVKFMNSVIGVVESSAFRLTSSAIEEILFHNVTIGRLDTDAMVTSQIDLLLQNSSVADMRSGSLRTEETGNIKLKNNYIIAHPGALSELKCSYSDHHITNNIIVLRDSGAQLLSEFYTDQETATNSSTNKAYLTLEKVLHPSCIPENLPTWATKSLCSHQPNEPLPSQEKPSSDVMYIVLYSLIGVCVIAVAAAILLSCVLVNGKNKRRRPVNAPPPIAMSQLHDSVYEEANPFLASLQAPPVPPPVQSCSDINQDTCSGNGCTSGTLKLQRAENTYISMH